MCGICSLSVIQGATGRVCRQDWSEYAFSYAGFTRPDRQIHISWKATGHSRMHETLLVFIIKPLGSKGITHLQRIAGSVLVPVRVNFSQSPV